MNLLGRKKDAVDFVGAVAATLPSPVKRGHLHFNPFLDTTRPGCFRPVAYNSPEKFQRVTLEGSNNYPSEFRFRRNISITTSGDSTRDFSSLASFAEDIHHAMGSSRRNSSFLPAHRMPSDMKAVMEASRVARDDNERAVASEGRTPHLINVRLLSRKTVSAEPRGVHLMSTSLGSGVRLSKSESCETSNVGKLPQDEAEDRVEVQRKGADGQKPRLEGEPAAKSALTSLNFARKITPDLREGLAVIRRLTRNASASGSETPRNDITENEDLAHGESSPADARGDEEAHEDRNLSKTGSLRKLLSMRRGDNDESNRRQPLRKLLRKTSKTLTNIFEFGRSADVDTGRINNCSGTDNAAANGESQRDLKKLSTSMGNTAMKRGIEEFAKVEKRGSSSAPASLSSRRNGNQSEQNKRESIERRINEVLGKDFLKHAVDVERYLDDLASP